MERLKKIVYKEKEILRIDYSDCKEDDMITLVTRAGELVRSEKKEVLLLTIFNSKNFVTPRFMSRLEKELKAAEKLIKKNAVIGLSKTQLWIVKGINLWFNKKIYPFESAEEALDFLAE